MITVVGGINIDIKAWPQAPLKRETSNPGTVSVYPGGVARNIAQVIAQLGGKAALAGAVGDDDWGRLLLGRTSRSGADISRVKICGGLQTDSYTALLTETGELDTAVSSMERIAEADTAYMESIRDLIEQSGFVVLDTNLKSSAFERVIDLAKNAGASVIAEPVSVAKAEKLRSLSCPVDFITPNLDELAVIAGSDASAQADPSTDAENLCRTLPGTFRHILVTMGARGVFHFDNTAADGGPPCGRRYPTYEARIRDATGAGDSFTGGLSYGLDAGLSIEESIHIGIACAVLTLESDKSVSEIISVDTVREVMHTRRQLS